MEFDWYQATLPAKIDVFLGDFVGRVSCDVEEARPQIRQYTNGADLVRSDGSRVAHCCWGGVNGDDVHVKATGGESPLVARVVREVYPIHRVSRADVAVDYDESGAWDSLSSYLMDVACRHDVKIDNRGDWHRGDDGSGRTVYIGSPKSVCMVRVYEKGKEQAAKGVEGVSSNWVRAEIQVRPKGESKRVASIMQPLDFWGSSAWSEEFGKTMFEGVLNRVCMKGERAVSDDERAFRFMLKQYSSVLKKQVARRGWVAVRSDIKAAIDAKN